MIGVISYGLGNTDAIINILREMGENHLLINNPNQLDKNINRIILPGVGSFDYAIELLKKKNFTEAIKNFVKSQNNYLLGICLGMQILANESDEGIKSGLGLIPGKIKKFKNIKIIPHVGWNNIKISNSSNLLLNIDDNSRFYFLHSYYFDLDSRENEVASSFYFNNFSSVVMNKNIFGVQFHPEKSHDFGKKLIKNFANLNEN